MVFDPCPHQLTQVVLRAGAIIREIQGLPPEPNVTLLYKWVAPLLGVPYVEKTSAQVNHLPSPAEMKKSDGGFVIPRQDCPICGARSSMILISLCPSCKDSEGGKYHSAWKCMVQGCEGIEKSEKFLTQRLSDMGISFESGSKKDMGIKTLTDKGLE